MADHLYLSYWLRGSVPLTMATHLEKALRLFPWSRLAPGATLRVHAISFQEPAIFERHYEDPLDLAEIVADAQQFLHADCAYQAEGNWDLWQFDEDWSLRPSRICIELFGPAFESDQGEQLRIDAGAETLYLPPASEPTGKLRPVESNIRSLIHLNQDLEHAFAVERRLLWSESGENFVGRFEGLL